MSDYGVRVERGLARHIREDSTQIAIRVSKIKDVQRAIEVLDSVRPYLDGLGVRFVNPAFPAPDGAMIWLDGKGVAIEQLLTIPDRIVQAFADAGFGDAVVGTAKGVQDSDPDYPREPPDCVSMTLLAEKPPPGTTVALPESWVAAGRQWWLEKAQDRRTWVSLVGRVYPVTVQVADEMLLATIASRSGGNAVVAGTTNQGAASLTCEFGRAPSMTLKLGGVPASEMLAAARGLVELTRDLADQVVYGVAEFLPTFVPGFPESHPVSRELEHRVTVMWGGDYQDYVFDAFPFQILSHGHLEHLPALPNAEPLAGGRVGLQLGDLERWLPGQDPSQLQAQGRALLEPCLRRRHARRRR